MLEAEAKTKICPHLSLKADVATGTIGHPYCHASGCMMWNWDSHGIEYLTDYSDEEDTLEEVLKKGYNKDKSKDGWVKREDGTPDWQRTTPNEERHGSCGLANLNVHIEGP